MNNERKIIHLDMDCFYAAIEMRDRPELKNKPIAVGGKPNERGIVCTANYLAREFGVRAPIPMSRAVKLCPDLYVIAPRFDAYRLESREIRKIFAQYTDRIEPLSLDEAYLDVSHEKMKTATIIAHEIKEKIKSQRQLTCSAGVSVNKLIAKIASDLKKPDGVSVIPPEKVAAFVEQLPVKKLWGVGAKTLEKISALGVANCAQLQKISYLELQHHFGKFGGTLYDFCRGIDHREVETQDVRKSLSVENTFMEDIFQGQELLEKVDECYEELKVRYEKELRKGDLLIKSLFVKVKYKDFSQVLSEASRLEFNQESYRQLVLRKLNIKDGVRLIGCGIKFHSTKDQDKEQLSFDL
jgi:DNA polymerase-4